jgi:hypothetical protein
MLKPFLVISGALLLMSGIDTLDVHAQSQESSPTPKGIAVVKVPERITASTGDVQSIATTASIKVASAPIVSTVTPASGTDAMQYIFQRESGNRLDAVNEIGACGLGQSLPCSKLSSVCPNWRTDRDCQVQFFSSYAAARYGSWDNAVVWWDSHKWW